MKALHTSRDSIEHLQQGPRESKRSAPSKVSDGYWAGCPNGNPCSTCCAVEIAVESECCGSCSAAGD